MTVATVRSTVRTKVAAVSGVQNVDVEQPYGRNPEKAAQARMEGDTPHFWLVGVNSLESGGGAGYLEPRRRVRIEGYLGLRAESPDGVSSYVRAANLEAAVEAALADPAFTLDVESLVPDGEIPTVDVTIGDRSFTCHRIGITAVIVEVT